ncbi:MAG: hypothetical protein O2910_02755 [Proteobacteria bacterium]|nr:hypothetical protein [Pseudomonadota bacterium]
MSETLEGMSVGNVEVKRWVRSLMRIWISLFAVLYLWSGPVSAGLTLPDIVIRIAEDRAAALRTEVDNDRLQIEGARSILNQYRDLVDSSQRDLDGMSNWATRVSQNFVLQEIERRQGMLREAEARLNGLIGIVRGKCVELLQPVS